MTGLARMFWDSLLVTLGRYEYLMPVSRATGQLDGKLCLKEFPVRHIRAHSPVGSKQATPCRRFVMIAE